MNNYNYLSNLSAFIIGLISQKNEIGYPYQSSGRILKNFDRFCLDQYPKNITLTQDMGLGWATLRDGEHQNGLLRRITPIRQLGKYMNSIGADAYVLPPKIPNKQIRYIPHIYTKQELSAFFNSLDCCKRSSFSGPVRHLVIPLFFRLLYCCGLRSSEALFLRTSDVDLDAGTIFIKESKGWKDRLLYLSDDVITLCRRYDQEVKKSFPEREAFFPNLQGDFYNHGIPDYWFHLFWDCLPEAKTYSGNSPRVHDFRHTFAVNRLNLWIQEGKDINAYLPYLSMYLGHVNFKDTDYYLHLVSEFHPLLKEKVEPISNNIIPEANYE